MRKKAKVVERGDILIYMDGDLVKVKVSPMDSGNMVAVAMGTGV